MVCMRRKLTARSVPRHPSAQSSRGYAARPTGPPPALAGEDFGRAPRGFSPPGRSDPGLNVRSTKGGGVLRCY